MQALEYIKVLRNEEFGYYIRRMVDSQSVIHTYQKQIDKFHLQYPTITLYIDDDSIQLQTEDRDTGIAFMNVFASDEVWNKQPHWDEKHIDYHKQVMHPNFPERLTLNIKCIAPPSALCRLVEEEVEVPATTIKKFRIVCDKTPTES